MPQCAQNFQSYVGISYLDSSLFFTYLLPSARGWEQSKDRAVICFVTTTGADLTVLGAGVTGYEPPSCGPEPAWVSRARCPAR